jgi:hypothetical protein
MALNFWGSLASMGCRGKKATGEKRQVEQAQKARCHRPPPRRGKRAVFEGEGDGSEWRNARAKGQRFSPRTAAERLSPKDGTLTSTVMNRVDAWRRPSGK